MIKPQPIDPSLVEVLADELSQNMSQAFTDSMVGDINIAPSTMMPSISSYNEYDLTISEPSMDELLKLANEHLVQVTETVTRDQIATVGEDEFKKRSKDVLVKKMQQDLTKKTKFTMLKDPKEETIVTKAKIYVFSEQDLRFFIENILKNH